MGSRRSFFALVLLLALAPLCSARRQTALDRYVHAPDAAYAWSFKDATPGEGYTAYTLEMTSQRWLTEEEVSRPVWSHWLTVYKPQSAKSRIGLLFITGGANDGKKASISKDLAQIATRTGSIVAELRMIPNQPLQFFTDGQDRFEDDLIAYTWDKYLRTGDERWPARLPMTKAAVRAMDTVTEFCRTERGGGLTVDRFVVSGGSKRGWTTWTTAAADPRVTAIVPLVIDLLNIEPSFEHHYRVYGFYAPAVKDYVEQGIVDWAGRKEYRSLMRMVEPWEYRDRLTMPKYIVNATGDQFFVPDSWKFYFDGLKGEKYLRYVPNTDHSLRGSDAQASLLSFYNLIVEGKRRPRFDWKVKNGTITVKAKDQPVEVRLWQAVNPKSRDFRLETIGKAWTSEPLKSVKRGQWSASLPAPETGFRAWMIELTYPGLSADAPLKFTTGVVVSPDRYDHDKYMPKPIQKTQEPHTVEPPEPVVPQGVRPPRP